MFYMEGRRYLPLGHSWRRARAVFNGNTEEHLPLPRTTGGEIYVMGIRRQEYLDSGGLQDGPDDPIHQTGVKRVSILYDLEYWQVRLKLNHSSKY
jgi:hypothetical protein